MTTPLEIMRGIGKQMLEGSPHSRELGMQQVSIERGEAVLKVPYRADLVGDPDTGVIAGGVVTALLDHVCGQAVIAGLDEMSPVATLDLRIDYMRAAEPGMDLFAHAHCYKRTRSIAFVRASAYDHDIADPVATAQAAFMIIGGGGKRMGSNLRPPRRKPVGDAA